MREITVKLDQQGKEPMYLQLYRFIVSEIMAGRIKAGEKLPSKRALCEHLKVSRSTVEGAYGILLDEGYVYTKPKSGFYVSEVAPLTGAGEGWPVLSGAEEAAGAEIKAAAEIEPGAGAESATGAGAEAGAGMREGRTVGAGAGLAAKGGAIAGGEERAEIRAAGAEGAAGESAKIGAETKPGAGAKIKTEIGTRAGAEGAAAAGRLTPGAPAVKGAGDNAFLQSGERVIDFSTSDIDTSVFPYASWAKIAKETVYQNPQLLKKGDNQGDFALREVLSGFLHEYRGVNCSPDQIILGGGMEHLLDMVVKLFEPDCLFGVEDPGYFTFYCVAQNLRRAVCPLRLDDDGIIPSELLEKDPNVVFCTPSHQFPTGVTMPIGRRAALLNWANAAEGRYIIEDDYDSEFRHLSRPIPAIKGLDAGGRVIYLGTFSRSIAPSFRAAYMVLPPKLLERYHEMFRHSACYVSRFEQNTLYLFIKRGLYGRHLRRAGNSYKKRAAYLIAQLSQIEGAVITGGHAGLHFVFTHPRKTERELVLLAAGSGVKVRGLSEYTIGKKPECRSVVLGYGGVSDEDAEVACARLLRAWK